MTCTLSKTLENLDRKLKDLQKNINSCKEEARAEEEVRMKELAEKFGSTKYTVKKCHPYFWFGNKVYVKC